MYEQGYIDEYGKLETSGGRHPILYGLNTDSAYFVGVDVTWNCVNIGIINFKGDILKLQMGIPFERRDNLNASMSYAATFKTLSMGLHWIKRKYFISMLRCADELILN